MMRPTALDKKVLVTGATGFVGRSLAQRLLTGGFKVRGTLLHSESPELLVAGVEPVMTEPLSADTSYRHCFAQVDAVIHLAARVHVMRERADDPLCQFEIANNHGTKNLAEQAAQAGVKRFIFMSTIGVMGDNSGLRAYTEQDTPKPHNHYSVSKYHAEQALQEISSKTGMEVVVLRAPLVYGPGNPGNFLSLLRIVASGMPLPFASLRNQRSLLFVGNLADALATCTTHHAAPGRIYLVSDGEDVSTPELIQRTAAALEVPARLFPFPPAIMDMVGRVTGRSKTISRLTGSLAVDSFRIRQELGWKPPFTMGEGLQATAEWYLKKTHGNSAS